MYFYTKRVKSSLCSHLNSLNPLQHDTQTHTAHRHDDIKYNGPQFSPPNPLCYKGRRKKSFLCERICFCWGWVSSVSRVWAWNRNVAREKNHVLRGGRRRLHQKRIVKSTFYRFALRWFGETISLFSYREIHAVQQAELIAVYFRITTEFLKKETFSSYEFSTALVIIIS